MATTSVMQISSFVGTSQTARAVSAKSPTLPVRGLVSAVRKSRTGSVVRASAVQPQQPLVVQIAENIGLPTAEGLFGFKPFAEVWVGRLAMMGFLTGMIEEVATGRGILGQIGFETPNPALFAAILGLATVATAYGTAQTIYKGLNKQLTAMELLRYRQFLGIQKEQQNVAQAAAALKAKGDFTSPLSLSAIDDARAAGSPADRLLSATDAAASDRAADELKASATMLDAQSLKESTAAADEIRARDAGLIGTSISLSAKDDVVEQTTFSASDFDYARQVEITNGRWAMLGFLSAIVVEAATGQGIFGQLVMWFKWAGLLGEASGF